jgi:hypothetical protein
MKGHPADRLDTILTMGNGKSLQLIFVTEKRNNAWSSGLVKVPAHATERWPVGPKTAKRTKYYNIYWVGGGWGGSFGLDFYLVTGRTILDSCYEIWE